MSSLFPSQQQKNIYRYLQNPGAKYSIDLWLLTAVLASFLCITHLLVLASFSFHVSVSGFLFPISLALACGIGIHFCEIYKLSIKRSTGLIISALLMVGLSLFLAGIFYDMSWDGLWYHQAAVYQMAKGWNPVADPMHIFTPNSDNQMWMRHYAKGAWYIALAVYQTTGNIEMAKITPWLGLIAAFLAALATGLNYSFKKRDALLLALLISCNPVVIFELVSSLVDGLMVSFLAVFLLSLARLGKKDDFLTRVLIFTSGVLAINAKFTGLVYLLIFGFATLIYFFIKHRDLFASCLRVLLMTTLLAVCLWGYNPYVTNLVFRGNPFYPMLGTKTFPSLAAQGEDPIEQWETPHNMKGQNRYVRLGYAIFGKPGAQPYYIGENAQLMVPFMVSWQDFSMYYFHDVRIAGLGPLYSGVFLLSLVLLLVMFMKKIKWKLAAVLLLAAIFLSLSLSVHTWWVRYGPQLWWIPLIPIIIGLSGRAPRYFRLSAYALAIILFFNVVLIAGVHFTWEIAATKATSEELAFLEGKKNVQADLQYFVEPFSERLRRAGIQFTPVKKIQNGKQFEFISVSPGYPCAVHVGYDE